MSSKLKAKVLIVDDDAVFLEEIQELLVEKAYQVRTCSDPTRVFLLIEEDRPDCIILDLAMPLLRGQDVLEILRCRYPYIPILICTGIPNVEQHSLIKAGAARIFMKPFETRDLFEAIDQAA